MTLSLYLINNFYNMATKSNKLIYLEFTLTILDGFIQSVGRFNLL